MTSTQKFFGFTIVPWYNSAEWQKVYSLILEENGNRESYQQAFDAISLWQIRMSLLPSGIEGTLCILEGLLADESTLTQRNYSIFCASSIMRFLNICVASRAQVMNFTRTVRQKSIPNWIINIRHDFAHSQKLPQPPLLKLALKESLQWLQENYWKPEFSKIKDNVRNGPRETTVVPNYNLSRLATFYGNMLVYTVKELPLDEYVQVELDNYEILQMENVEIFSEILGKMYESATYNQGNCDYIVEDILNTNCFYINPNNLSDINFKCFTNILAFLQQNGCICKLIRELGNVVYDEIEVSENRQAAADWLNEIFQAILKLRRDDRKAKWKFTEFSQRDVDELIGMKFSLLKSLDSLTKSFYKSFLDLNTLGINGGNSEFCKELEKAMSRKFYQNVISSTDDSQDLFEQLKDCGLRENLVEMVEVEKAVPAAKRSKRWNRVDNTVPFETCAIGRLPMEIF